MPSFLLVAGIMAMMFLLTSAQISPSQYLFKAAGEDTFSTFADYASSPLLSPHRIRATDPTDSPPSGPYTSTIYLSCSRVIYDYFHVEVPFAAEGLTISINQEPEFASNPNITHLPWRALFRWDEPATYYANDFEMTNSSSSWASESLTIPAPRGGVLFGFITLDTNPDPAADDACSSAFVPDLYTHHPPSDSWAAGRVRFDIDVEIVSCHFASDLNRYTLDYTQPAFSARGMGSSGTATACGNGFVKLEDGNTPVPKSAVYAGGSPSSSFLGTSLTCAYFDLNGPHAAVEIGVSTFGGTMHSNVFVRYNALAVPTSVYGAFPGGGSHTSGLPFDGYFSALDPGTDKLVVENPPAGFYTVCIDRSSPFTFNIDLTRHPITSSSPGSVGDAPIYVGYPYDDGSYETKYVIPDFANGIHFGATHTLDGVELRDGSDAMDIAVFALRFPGLTSSFTLTLNATLPVNVYFRKLAPPAFDSSYNPHALAAPLALGVTDTFFTTDNVERGTYYVAVVPVSQPALTSWSVDVRATREWHCHQNCKDHGYCYIDGSGGECACWEERSTDGSVTIGAYSGDYCEQPRCDHGSCSECIADPACSWCLSTGVCLSGAGMSLTGNAVHALNCPATPHFPGTAKSRLVYAPATLWGNEVNEYGSCPELAPFGTYTQPNGTAHLLSPTPLGSYFAASVSTAQCGSRVYHYAPPSQKAASIIVADGISPATVICEFWSFDTTTQEWEDLTAYMGDGVATGPGCRAAASLVCFADDNELVLFGGALPADGSIPGERIRHSSDVWTFDLASATWSLTFPNCYDPHNTLAAWSTTPHPSPVVPAACSTPGLELPGTAHAAIPGAWLAAVDAVLASDSVFAARGILVSSTFSHSLLIDGVASVSAFDKGSYFFNLSASPPSWSRLQSADGSFCDVGYSAAWAYSAPTARQVFAAGIIVSAAGSEEGIYGSTRSAPCQHSFFRADDGSLQFRAERYDAWPSPQRFIWSAMLALDDGSLLFVPGTPLGTSFPEPFAPGSGRPSPTPAPSSFSATAHGNDLILLPGSRGQVVLPARPVNLQARISPILVHAPGGSVYELGGTIHAPSEGEYVLDSATFDQLVYDRSNRWSVVSPDLSPGNPGPRSHAILAHLPSSNELLVVGGLPTHARILDEHTFVGVPSATMAPLAIPRLFDLNTRFWRSLPASPLPASLPSLPVAAASCVTKTHLYVYGGLAVTETSEHVSDTLLRLDLATGTWSDLTTSGTRPPPLTLATAVCTDNGKLFLVGGVESRLAIHGTNSDINSLPKQFFVLDIASRVWSSPAGPAHLFPIQPAARLWTAIEASRIGLSNGAPRLALATATTSPYDGTMLILTYDIFREVWDTRELVTGLPPCQLCVLSPVFASIRSAVTQIRLTGGGFSVTNLAGGATGSAKGARFVWLAPDVSGSGPQGALYRYGGMRDPSPGTSSRAATPGYATGELVKYEPHATAVLAANVATTGVFNVANSLEFRASLPGWELHDVMCGFDGVYGPPASKIGSETLTCTLPTGPASSTVSVSLAVGAARQSVLTDVSYTFTDCLPGSYKLLGMCATCELGHFSDTFGALECVPCISDTYTSAPGATSCETCPPGQVLDSANFDRKCVLCPRGKFRADNGTVNAKICTECAVDEYADTEGSTACTKCPAGSIVGTPGGNSLAKCTCDNGYWGNATAAPCTACPPVGAVCKFLENELPVPTAGYWRDPQDPTRYYPLSGRCEPCPDNAIIPVIVAFLLLFVVIVVMYKFAGRSKSGSRSGSSGAASIALNFIQTTALFAAYKMNWPDEMLTILKWFSIMNLNMDMASPECALPISYKIKWFSTMLIPIAIALVFGSYVVVRTALSWIVAQAVDPARLTAAESESESETEEQEDDGGSGSTDGIQVALVAELGADEESARRPVCASCLGWLYVSKAQRGAMYNQAIHAYVMFVLVAYVFVAHKALEVFACTKQTDGTYFLNAHPSMKCYVGEWWDLLPWTILAALLYCAGIPLVFAAVLVKSFKPAFSSANERLYELHVARFGILTSRYLLRAYMWELVVMGRKMAIVAGTLFFQEMTVLQNLVALFVMFAAVLAQSFARPYRSPDDNKLEFILLCTSYFVLFLGIMFASDLESTSSTVLTVVGVAVLVLSVLAIVLYLLLLARRFYYMRRYAKAAAKHPRLVKRAEFVLTEPAYFELMDFVDNVDEPEREAITTVLEDLHERTVDHRREEEVPIFVQEVQTTFAIYRQTATPHELQVLDRMIARITRAAKLNREQSLKSRVLHRATTRRLDLPPPTSSDVEAAGVELATVAKFEASSSSLGSASVVSAESADAQANAPPGPRLASPPLLPDLGVQPPTPEQATRARGPPTSQSAKTLQESTSSRRRLKSSGESSLAAIVNISNTDDVAYKHQNRTRLNLSQQSLGSVASVGSDISLGSVGDGSSNKSDHQNQRSSNGSVARAGSFTSKSGPRRKRSSPRMGDAAPHPPQ
ncbi:uncharacterized protein AMSG_08032 [Thecamonas trahens ATCC 50062]|uniref:Tyrosine-protein kinase ephrin type A/B receptor-like domain-containing protein n=1 Tax=Thecamonas trahens ATCC 50062 TaxID=461836 RepID=A0A0L0DJT9_THETB|nr:hypothetical protein AMSG_08032 [Thecamonas trahens ATCC 50062]KNC52475.1 hypothetical protein AMSG_08032 [Thecamonas trahens ATCC 50062]|eukprot:XP_013755275.1 hypothetical protein AMSG_08032 [Thecamonas trahens ATCC 50062]